MSNIAPPQQRYWKERYAEMLEMPSEKAYGVAVESFYGHEWLAEYFVKDMEDAADALRRQAGFVDGKAALLYDQMKGAQALMTEMLEALKGCERWIVDLAESGDAGFWDAGQVPEVIAARSAITKATALTQPKEG